MGVRAPQLHHALRAFTLGAFAYLLRELDDAGESLPFAFEEHGGDKGPALYEYRPLVRDFVEARASRLRGRDDATIALEELHRERAAAIYARAHAGPEPTEDDALFRTVLVDLLVRVAEACGGFDWDDDAFDRCYAELEQSLFGESRAYAAVAPLVGLTTGIQRELGPGIRVRAAADGELARHWPEARGLLPKGFGREADRYCVLELRSALAPDEEVPDAPAEVADAVSALRLATAAPLAAGPVLFETLDGRPYGIRPVLPIAATQPPGRADPPRRVSRAARRRAPRSSLARRRRHDPRGGARPLGAVPLPARALPVRAAPGCTRRAVRLQLAPARRGPARVRRRAPRDAAQGARGPVRGRRGGSRRRRGRPARSRRGAPRRRPAGARRAARPHASRSRGARPAPRRLVARPRGGLVAAVRWGCIISWAVPPGRRSHTRHERGTDTSQLCGYRRLMEEARSVLERFERIESMRRANAGPVELLGELRALLREAEEWAKVEGGDDGDAAVARLRDALARDMIGA